MVTADTVLMVPPTHFNFNEETAKSNAFQHKLKLNSEAIHEQAQLEFQAVVDRLTTHGINVLQLASPTEYTPDAVFPNNWFSTHLIQDKPFIFIYPMLCENRRKEVQLGSLQKLLNEQFSVNYGIFDFRFDTQAILEGTGALIFDHQAKVAFVALSERADQNLAKRVADKLGYELITFNSFDKNNNPIYHTNVLLSIGEQFAFVCLTAIKPLAVRNEITEKLKQMGKVIIDLSLDQIYSMAANVLELKNQQQQHFLALSTTADQALSAQQKKSTLR